MYLHETLESAVVSAACSPRKRISPAMLILDFFFRLNSDEYLTKKDIGRNRLELDVCLSH